MPFTFVDLLEGLTGPPVSSALAGILAIVVLILTITWCVTALSLSPPRMLRYTSPPLHLPLGGPWTARRVTTYQPCHFEENVYTSLSWDAGGEGALASCVFNWHPILMVGSMVRAQRALVPGRCRSWSRCRSPYP